MGIQVVRGHVHALGGLPDHDSSSISLSSSVFLPVGGAVEGNCDGNCNGEGYVSRVMDPVLANRLAKVSSYKLPVLSSLGEVARAVVEVEALLEELRTVGLLMRYGSGG